MTPQRPALLAHQQVGVGQSEPFKKTNKQCRTDEWKAKQVSRVAASAGSTVEAKLQKGQAAVHAMHAVLHNNHLPLHICKLALIGSVMPAVHYAAEVWSGSIKADTRKKLDSWNMSVVTSMMYCPANAAHAC